MARMFLRFAGFDVDVAEANVVDDDDDDVDDEVDDDDNVADEEVTGNIENT